MTKLELNLGHYDDPLIRKSRKLVRRALGKSCSLRFSEIYNQVLLEIDPYMVYLKVLFELYQG